MSDKKILLTTYSKKDVIDEIHLNMFDPITEVQWRLLKELKPKKSRGSYQNYLNHLNKKYLKYRNDLNYQKENLSLFDDINIYVALNNDDIEESINKIDKIENTFGFIKWNDLDAIDKFKNLPLIGKLYISNDEYIEGEIIGDEIRLSLVNSKDNFDKFNDWYKVGLTNSSINKMNMIFLTDFNVKYVISGIFIKHFSELTNLTSQYSASVILEFNKIFKTDKFYE